MVVSYFTIDLQLNGYQLSNNVLSHYITAVRTLWLVALNFYDDIIVM